MNAAHRWGPMSTSVGLSAAGDAPSTGGGYACACADLAPDKRRRRQQQAASLSFCKRLAHDVQAGVTSKL